MIVKIKIKILFQIIHKFSFSSIVLKDDYQDYTVFDFNRDFDNTLTNSFAYKILPWIKFENYKAYRDFIKLYRKTI